MVVSCSFTFGEANYNSLPCRSKTNHERSTAPRDNTRKTYRSAVEHFEVHWGGKLPTTPENMGRYLVTYANDLAPSTLKTRLAALSQWHKTQGFSDPCSSVHVRKIMRGIQAVHSKKPKQAHPLQITF